MSVLVTGVAGFLGSHLADCLVAEGQEVIGLDDLSGGFRENVPPAVVFQEGSILDTERLERMFRKHRIEHVFHLAAYAAEGLSHFIRRFNYTNNVVGSVNLINLAVRFGVKCFVFTSSIAVYGSSQVPMTERTTPQPEDPYGIAKRAVELDLEAARRLFGLNYIVFRPHNVYGERQHIGDRYRNVIGIFMNQLMRGEAMTIFGDGEQTRNFTYTLDVAPVIAGAVRQASAFNRVFNIGSDEVASINQLAVMVAAAMGQPVKILRLPERKEVRHAQADHGELVREFGFHPKWCLREGLPRMAAWAKRVGCREPSRFRNIEVDRNLPEIWRSAAGGPTGPPADPASQDSEEPR